MQVHDVMTCGAEVISPEATIQEAAQKMKDLDIGPLPVCANGRLVGMITDRDIAIRSTAEGDDPFTDHVRDIMTPEINYCFDDDDVTEAAQRMQEAQVRWLAVLDHAHHLVGMVSIGDLANRANETIGGGALGATARPGGASSQGG